MTALYTAILLVLDLALAGFCLWRGLAPSRGTVRMVPWMPLGLFFIALGLMLLAHLVNMFGIETGGRFR